MKHCRTTSASEAPVSCFLEGSPPIREARDVQLERIDRESSRRARASGPSAQFQARKLGTGLTRLSGRLVTSLWLC